MSTQHHHVGLPPPLSATQIASLLERVDKEIASAQEELHHAQPIAEAAGLSVHSSVLDPSYQAKPWVGISAGSAASADGASSAGGAAQNPAAAGLLLDLQQEAALVVTARQSFNPLRGTLSAYPLVLSTTGGYSNNDHIVHQNPQNGSIDKLSEYKRALKRRHRQVIVEQRGADRWDLPRRPGGRRRRIKRDVDLPSAPPEPPNSGYVVYVSQMTTKLRNDNPNRHHNQINAVRKISSMWNAMPDTQREHYKQLAKEATAEYEERLIEYRATGSWTPYSVIERLARNKNGVEINVDRGTGCQGPWVRIPYAEKNELERELETYDQVLFPPRPKDMEKEHERKIEESKAKRKKKREEANDSNFRWE
ncbi:hypothetical protein ACHAXM_008935 [Skeletonema potamos]